jgi:hypothetical protein
VGQDVVDLAGGVSTDPDEHVAEVPEWVCEKLRKKLGVK